MRLHLWKSCTKVRLGHARDPCFEQLVVARPERHMTGHAYLRYLPDVPIGHVWLDWQSGCCQVRCFTMGHQVIEHVQLDVTTSCSRTVRLHACTLQLPCCAGVVNTCITQYISVAVISSCKYDMQKKLGQHRHTNLHGMLRKGSKGMGHFSK